MIVGVLQARVSSSRLPGKVLRPILSAPMLSRQIERVRRAGSLDRLVVATSTDPSDDLLENLAGRESVSCHRGSLDDVLSRVYEAARAEGATHVVRLTGDCPLADPQVIDEVVAHHLRHGFDYTSNALVPTFPDGLDVEAIAFAALRTAMEEARPGAEREHVTLHIYRHPERFRIGDYRRETDLSHLRWTVDEPEDFALVTTIYEALYPGNPAFSTEDILELLEANPHLKQANVHIRRNEGLERSEATDRARG